MGTALNIATAVLARPRRGIGRIHRPEWITLSFFAYLGVLSFLQPLPITKQIVLLGIPVALTAIWRIESRRSSAASRVVRQWCLLALMLLGYWSVGWFTPAVMEEWQSTWVAWDRTLLDTCHLRAVIEMGGAFAPSVLETAYLLLYALAPACLGVVYWLGGYRAANRFLTVLLLGTFSAYALLPLFPVASPRLAFPAEDLPSYCGAARTINTWLLDHLDIYTSVFPSGHVAVAFSSALGLFTVLRERRAVWITGFLIASTVYTATVYGRYHYAVDGIASIAIACSSWKISHRLRNHD